MVEIVKRRGYGARVGALQGNFGTPFETGIAGLQADLNEARAAPDEDPAAIDALETAPDGATRRWRNQDSGHNGTITPTRTYLSASGHFCRDHREELAIGEQSGRFHHTAYRDDAERWTWL